jgi:hypothetical protein
MSSFDYNAPAELFLSKPAKGSRTKYRRFATAAEALRYAVEDLRTPKAFGRTWRLGMSASTAAKSNACTKPKAIRCASLNDRAPTRTSSQRD